MALEDVQIIDNFCSQEYFDQLKEWIEVSQPWSLSSLAGFGAPNMPDEETQRYIDHFKDLPPDANIQFVATHITFSPTYFISDNFPRFIPLFQNLKARVPVRLKVNLNVAKEQHIHAPYHYDANPPEVYGDNCTVAILHLNTCNGWTSILHPDLDNFEQKIDTVANRVIIFSNKYQHRGVACTDQPYRSVINLNYYGEKLEA